MTLGLDLDGTLISCEPRQSAVLRAALVEHGARANIDDVWHLKREGDSTAVALQKCGLTSSVADDVAGSWRRMIEEPCWLNLDSVFEGVPAVLASWQAEGMELVLLTARARSEWIRPQLRHLGLDQFFASIECVNPDAASSEKANVLRRRAAVAFIGDTESDAKAAQTADVPFLAVASGQRSVSFFQRSGIEACFDDIGAVRNLFPPVNRFFVSGVVA